MSFVTVNKDNIGEVKNSDKRVLLDFYANWCGPCRTVLPIVGQIADENPQYLVGKVNVDEEPQLVEEFGVITIPTLVVLEGGRVIDRSVGVKPKRAILEMLTK